MRKTTRRTRRAARRGARRPGRARARTRKRQAQARTRGNGTRRGNGWEMGRTGTPKEPLEEQRVSTTVKLPLQMWAELNELVPEGERSALIHRLLERELKRLRRQR